MADFNDDIFFATLTELNSKLKAREFSAAELARAFSTRLEQLGPRYKALVLPLKEEALRKARDVDGDMKRGRFRGPLQGVRRQGPAELGQQAHHVGRSPLRQPAL